MATLEAKELASSKTVIPMGTLSTAATGSDVIDLLKPENPATYNPDGYFENVSIQSVVAIGSSSKVTLRVEGNIDNSDDWVNLDTAKVDTDILESGASIFTFDNSQQEIRFIRVYFVSETGATDATIVNSAVVN